ncbi:MAG TPA: hypothetical protein VGD36_05140 [Xanthobacteraceae bacterium]
MDAKTDHAPAGASEPACEIVGQEAAATIETVAAPPLQAEAASDPAETPPQDHGEPAVEPHPAEAQDEVHEPRYSEAPMFVATPDQRAAYIRDPEYDWTSVYTAPDEPLHHQVREEPAAKSRFWLLAASIAVAASVGAAAGAAGFAGVVTLATPAAKPPTMRLAAPLPAPLGRADLAEETKSLKEALGQVRGSMRSVSDTVVSLKSNVETSGKTSASQIGKLGEMLVKLNETVERLERSQAEPAARLAKVSETLERLEKRAAVIAAAPEPTGSVRAAAAPPLPPASTVATSAAAAPAAAVIDATGAKAPVVEGWIVRRVYDGVALVEGRNGVSEVEPGDNIRGVGRVQEIKRQDGQWVVVTSRGVILSR